MVQVMEQDLHLTLSNLSKQKLISILLDLADENPDIEKRLLFQFAHNQDEIAASKKLVKEYIRKAKDRGFIPWNRVDYALQGAELVIRKAKEKIDLGDVETAVTLGIVVLSHAVDMLQFADDSNGTIGDIIRYSLEVIDNAIGTSIARLEIPKQKKLFNTILKEALHKRYNGWSDVRVGLLRVCIYFCGINDLRTKLESQIESLINQTGRDYEREELKLLQLGMMERYDESEKVETFIYENIQLSDFREKAILHEMEKRDYTKVISLCLEGEGDNPWPGLIKKWKEYRYQAYEQLEDIEKQRVLAKELLYDNDFEYYSKLKELYPSCEWEGVLHEIVEEFRKQPYQPSAYLSILKEENLTEHILEYCKENLSSLTHLYPYLMEQYFEELTDLFIQYILIVAKESNDRRKYKNVCRIIETYKQACGKEHAEKLISKLKESYKRRPAFVEELEKIK
ncbi:DUF6880 family protein [Neobacillus mesonae]|uniref:DUF6880 family protein n=1 Tax=Neobacillus mesonae TaxID=1193713 RepID=UPI0020421291|nr:DUF6880 family protein [Neobacillus mesonae]MCM3569723.1 hypothetical protein [Neobacillus mesonae]